MVPIRSRTSVLVLALLTSAVLVSGPSLRNVSAESTPPVSAPISVEEANRKGWDALEREDYAAALGWFRKAADQGDAFAQAKIGNMYFKGLGVTQDYVEAMRWFRKAADQGDAPAQALVGYLYKKGLGVPKDDAQAIIWWRKAAEQGDPKIQTALAFMYVEGEGVPKDYGRAMTWFRKAADQGYAGAQTAIGSLYRDGMGVPKDYAQAELWYRKAIAQGDDEAKEKLAEMQKKTSEGTGKANKIPPALYYKCFFMSEAYKYPGAEGEKRYNACLRSNWQQFMGSAPFPLD